MTYETTFNVVAHELSLKAHYPTDARNPVALADEWEALINECETGYHRSFHALQTEISLRDLIRYIIADSRLTPYPEHNAFIARISTADQRLRRLFVPGTMTDDNRWWAYGILRRAGQKYLDTTPLRFRHKIVNLSAA